MLKKSITQLAEDYSTQEDLRTKFLTTKTFEEAREVAVGLGYDVNLAEVEALAKSVKPVADGEMSDEDLESAAGGLGCCRFCGGGSGAASTTDRKDPYRGFNFKV